MSSNNTFDTPQLVIVVAAASNGVIGEHNRLPWSLPSELKRFREMTIGHPCIIGRKTWEGIGKPLKGRDNIVVTRGRAIAVDGVVTMPSLETAIEAATAFAQARQVRDIMVIGGGEIYRQTLPLARKIYLTEVDMTVAGDTYFPVLAPAEWVEIARESHAPGPKDTCGFVIKTLERRAAG